MTPRLTTTDDDVVACPECDLAGEVWERTHPHRDFDKPFKCHKCGAEFDDPNRRPPKPKSTGNTDGDAFEDPDGLPAQLDPDVKETIRSIRGS